MDEDNAFAAPPSDQPIILGEPPSDVPSFAAAPVDDGFLGTVDETAGGDAPIILGPPTTAGDEDGEEQPVVEEEPAEPAGPTPMQKFNEEWQAILLERKDHENARKAELLDAAKSAMEEFQAQREQKREAKMAKNRADEQAKLEAIEADLENDNSWQQVCKMVELSHDSASADVKRIRDALILLKNDNERATRLS